MISTLRHRLSLFVVVGFLGFLVDAGVLWAVMHGLHFGLYLGRVLSFLVAATTTWYLNRVLTYRDRAAGSGLTQQWTKYMAASSLGAAVNYGVYCAVVATLPIAARLPTLGVAAGSLAGLLFNFNIYGKLVFRAGTRAAHRNPPADPGS